MWLLKLLFYLLCPIDSEECLKEKMKTDLDDSMYFSRINHLILRVFNLYFLLFSLLLLFACCEDFMREV